MEWVEDQDNDIANEALEQQFGPIMQNQLTSFSERANKSMWKLRFVLGAPPSGLEALRRLVRRWDPLSEGKRRALPRQILAPDRCKLQHLRFDRARLVTYEHVRLENQAHIEARQLWRSQDRRERERSWQERQERRQKSKPESE